MIPFAVALLIAGGSPAQTPTPSPGGWQVNGAPAKPTPSLAGQGDFGVQQIATLDPDGLVAKWNTPTDGVEVSQSTEMPRNTPIVTFIIFYGCKPKATDGLCDVVAEFDVTGPTGKAYAHQQGAIWAHEPPGGYSLQLSEVALGITVEGKDDLGAYTVKTAVTDRVAGITLHTQQVLTAVEKLPPSAARR